MKMKRVLTSILAAALMLGLMSVSAGAQEVDNDANSEQSAAKTATSVLEYGDIVYYGDIPWIVLSKDYSTDSTDADAEKGILLLSKHAMANGIQYNAHYSNNAWSSDSPVWASAMVMPWNDERNPMYKENMASGKKTDDSSGGYITSDIRAYLTGLGEYEAFRPFAYYNESWPASWDTMPDRNGQGWRYYTREIVTDSKPAKGVTYFVKGEFELSDHNRSSAKVNNVTVPGMVALTIADWAEDTWYTLDANGDPVLMTEWPEGATTVNAYYDQAGYTIADVSNGFEDGVTYYTFERYLENVCPKVTVNGVEYAMGEHLAGLYKWVGYAVPELTVSDSNDALTETTFVAGLSASEKNFASDLGLSEIELDAVLPVSGHGYNRGSGFNGGWSGSIGSTFGDRLDNDTFFLLSGEEVKYYLTDGGYNKNCTHLDEAAAGDLWTRSWGRADIQTVITYANNGVNWYKGANTWWQSIRPAFVLDPDAVALLIPGAGEATLAEETSNEYRLILKNEEATDFEAELVTVGAEKAVLNYSDAKYGDYISLAVFDLEGSFVAYMTSDEIKSENGTVEFDISDLGNIYDFEFYVFNESTDGGVSTGYASKMETFSEFAVAEEITLEFEETPAGARGEKLYNINLTSADKTIINRLNSIDLTFELTQNSGENAYEIIASNNEVAINPVNNNDNRYEFHYDGKDDVVTDTSSKITIGQVKFTGYGNFDFAVKTADTNVAHATTEVDNIVDTFVPGGILDGEAVGEFDVSDDTITGVEIFAPTQDLTIKVAFPNAIINNKLAYQAMNILVTGEDIADISIDLGTDNTGADLTLTNKTDAAYTVAFDETNSVYTIVITNALTANTAYNVAVSGAGYRTARYTVNTQEKDKILNFWNNVKDNAIEVEEDKASSKKNVTFLAGDIVKDAIINIYDLSAVVSYFGEVELSETNNKTYAKYDLNRDGKIDSKDVAYVLVSWGN